MRSLWIALCVLVLPVAFGIKCPISSQRASSLNLSGIKQACSTLNSSDRASCDLCLCSITDIVLPELERAGYDIHAAGGLDGAESVLQACMTTLALPLTSSGVSLSKLIELTNCPFERDGLPTCVQQHVPDPVEPMTYNEESSSDHYREESFVEDVAAECICSAEFDPVCSYNGFWYTNYCVAKCKGAKVVERCSPVFKAIEQSEEPFLLTERESPLRWKSGCYCPQNKQNFYPVCDIDANQYPSPCYAQCLGIGEVVDCRHLVVDFVLSGEGPIEEPSKAGKVGDYGSHPSEAGSLDREPTSIYKDTQVKGSTAKGPRKPSKGIYESSSTDKTKGTTDKSAALPEEVEIFFHQLGLDDVHYFPPDLAMMAYKMIQGDQITKADLQRAREVLEDEEQMHEARQRISPSSLSQMQIFATAATGNNKALMEELVETLTSIPVPAGEEKSNLRKCLEKCKSGKPVCDSSNGDEYASPCHARCSGVKNFKTCYYYESSSISARLLSEVLVTYFSLLIAVLYFYY